MKPGSLIDTPRLDAWVESHPRLLAIHDAMDTWLAGKIRKFSFWWFGNVVR